MKREILGGWVGVVEVKDCGSKYPPAINTRAPFVFDGLEFSLSVLVNPCLFHANFAVGL